jgi:hypothetical protein
VCRQDLGVSIGQSPARCTLARYYVCIHTRFQDGILYSLAATIRLTRVRWPSSVSTSPQQGATVWEKPFLDPIRILDGLPHPSGANGERIAFFLGRTARSALSPKTSPDPIESARDRMREQVKDLFAVPAARLRSRPSRICGRRRHRSQDPRPRSRRRASSPRGSIRWSCANPSSISLAPRGYGHTGTEQYIISLADSRAIRGFDVEGCRKKSALSLRLLRSELPRGPRRRRAPAATF